MQPVGEAYFLQEPEQVKARTATPASHSTHQELRLGQGENCLRPSAATSLPQSSAGCQVEAGQSLLGLEALTLSSVPACLSL